MDQAHILYNGRVQGVGFRFTVQRYALSLGLTGWVKNCPNGSVEALVEGQKEKIERLCQDIEEYFKGHIDCKEIHYTPAQKQFNDFQITY